MSYQPPPGSYDPQPIDPTTNPPTHQSHPLTAPPMSAPPVTGPPMYAPQQPPQPGPRPQVTTAAAMLMALGVLSSAGVVLVASFDTLAGATGPTQSGDQAFALTMGGIGLLATLSSIVLALGVLKGRTWARIVSFVYYGISLLCTGFGSFMLAMVGQSSDSGTALDWASLVLFMVSFFVFAAVIILLALPDTGRWFREVAQARRFGVG